MTHNTELDEVVELTEEEKTLQYTTDIRKKIISKAFLEEKLPADRLEAQMLMDSLGALERTAISKLRIKTDKENSKANGALAVELARIVSENVSNRRPDTPVRDDVPEPAADLLDNMDIPDFELVIDNPNMTYQEFKDKQG